MTTPIRTLDHVALPVLPGWGRGRVAACVPGAPHGLRLECTEVGP